MEKKKDWNPELYLKFRNERTQPSVDLVNRIHIEFQPVNALDVGCGPGNSSQVLLDKWPGLRLTGMDNSPAMIDKAKKDYPGQDWVLADAFQYQPGEKFDIVFSNATIQWIPDHPALLARLSGMLSDRGVLAVQVPQFIKMPVGIAIRRVAGSARWAGKTKGSDDLFTFHDAGFYYDILSAKCGSVEIWETHYFHVLESHMAVLEWVRGAGLKPYLDRLGESDKKDFEDEILLEIEKDYPAQKDGKVLFPFRRLFFIGYR